MKTFFRPRHHPSPNLSYQNRWNKIEVISCHLQQGQLPLRGQICSAGAGRAAALHGHAAGVDWRCLVDLARYIMIYLWHLWHLLYLMNISMASMASIASMASTDVCTCFMFLKHLEMIHDSYDCASPESL